MNILHVSTYDIQGGAAKAAYRLHQGLRQIGQENQIVVRHKVSTDASVLAVTTPVNVPNSFTSAELQEHYIDTHRTPLSSTIFSLPHPGYDLSTLTLIQTADVINLHWVARFQSLVTLQKLFSLGKPVVWTLHDQWAFTGGCHYSAGCKGYQQNCTACPQLADELNHIPEAILMDKFDLWRDANLTIVTPSRWLADCAQESALFQEHRIEVIANSVETNVFRPMPKAEAKGRLGLAANTVTLLFGAVDTQEKRKGFHSLLEAMQHCASRAEFQRLVAANRLKILCFGYPNDELETTGLPVMSLGYLNADEQIALAYAAADLFVLPSLEDNLPNTMLEAMSCGTPVVGFQVGGLPDMVKEGQTGQLVPPGEVKQLGETILNLIAAPQRLAEMGQNCRRLIETGYTLPVQAQRYLDLYNQLLSTSPQPMRDVTLPVPTNRDEPPDSPVESLAPVETAVGPNFHAIYESVLFKAIEESNQATLQAQLAASETDRAAKAQTIANLQDMVAGLSTTEGALGKLIAIYSRKMGLYSFLKQHEPFLRGVYSTLYNRLSTQPRAQQVALPAASGSGHNAQVLIHSPLVEALTTARAIAGDTDEQLLVRFYELGQNIRHILCLHPSDNNIQALYMLARAGAIVTSLNCQTRQAELQSYGFNISSADLGDWLATNQPATLSQFDSLSLEALQLSPEILLVLKGRLHPDTRVLVTSLTARIDSLDLSWGPPAQVIDGLAVYHPLPEAWYDPASSYRSFHSQTNWPWKTGGIKLPPTLPSGRPWPKISVVTVTLNQGGYLEETIRSVLLQGYPNLEYIVLDGGSTDNTPVILNRYRSELAHCVSEKDEGQADALNKGFRLASGDILAWLNSDDRYLPDTLLRVALAFDVYEADMVAGGCALVYGDTPTPFRTHHNRMPIGQVVPLPLNKLLDVDGSWQKGDFFYQPEVFWTRDLWERSGGQVDKNLFYSMDYELWLRMAKQNAKLVHIPDTLALFRMHTEQKTSGHNLPFLPELRRVNAAFKKELRRT